MNHRAKPIAADWPTRRVFVPQGADQQGRQVPSIPFEAASACAEIGANPEPVVGRELAKVWLILMTPGVTVLAGLCAWAWVHFHA